MTIHPQFGDTYSFPWRRSPHEAICEYNESSQIFDNLRNTLWSNLYEFDWLARFVNLFNSAID